MLRKTIMGAFAVAAGVAAGVAAAVAVKAYKDIKKNKTEETEKGEDEVHFIKIDSDVEPETKVEENLPHFDLEGKPEEVKEICGVYPYLDPDFVEQILARDEDFNHAYEEDTLVSMKHKVSFESDEDLASYADIMEDAGYDVEIQDHRAEASRKFFIQQGAIISDILNVANQTVASGGVYEGYEVQ